MAWKKFVFATDLHGDMQESSVVKRFLQFVDEFQPRIKIFGGDLFDLRGLRSKASPEEKAESMREDWQKGLNFLQGYQPHHLLYGNHDLRLFQFATQKRGIEKDYAMQGVTELASFCDQLKIKTKPYDKRQGILKIGRLSFLHGYAHGVGAARKHAMVYKHCMFGHTHAVDLAVHEDLDRSTARNVGCLCKLDLGYNAATITTLRQAHGWAYGVINDKTGEYYALQAEKRDGQWFIPSI